jgi:hypothetical protein
MMCRCGHGHYPMYGHYRYVAGRCTNRACPDHTFRRRSRRLGRKIGIAILCLVAAAVFAGLIGAAIMLPPAR